MLVLDSWLDLIDERFAWVAAAAALAGLVRGFSGFGSAMIFVPVASAIYEPRIAVVLLFIFDGPGHDAHAGAGLPALHLARGAAADRRRHCRSAHRRAHPAGRRAAAAALDDL